MNPHTEAQHVLNAEAAALTTLAEKLDEAFTQTIDLFKNLSGRVIVTGMGKSGHIGAKLAATLASTGTPAFFVHPGEASHGDLGMIGRGDAVLALSHSGESRELSDILAYCTRFGIPLVAITGNPASSLGKAATHILNTHVTVEACPIGKAPMTSTTVSLALGDALAASLMQARGFEPSDFATFHPGGKLGAQLLTVKEIMRTSDLPVLQPTVTMKEVLVELTSKNAGGVCFVEHDKLVGIFTDGDVKRHLTDNFLTQTAATVMTRNPITTSPDTLATRAVALMEEKNITMLPVVQEEALVGMLQLQHCLQHGVV